MTAKSVKGTSDGNLHLNTTPVVMPQKQKAQTRELKFMVVERVDLCDVLQSILVDGLKSKSIVFPLAAIWTPDKFRIIVSISDGTKRRTGLCILRKVRYTHSHSKRSKSVCHFFLYFCLLFLYFINCTLCKNNNVCMLSKLSAK